VSSGDTAEAQRLATYDVVRLRAENAGPLTLSGTNTWVVGRDPVYVVDPGPALDEHLESLVVSIEQRGGLGGIALTHDHLDHSEAVALLLERLPAPLAAARGEADVRLLDGIRFALIAGPVCFTGDAVLGEGSVFIAQEPGALAGYLAGLERLRDRAFEVLCPGHGPAIWDPRAKLDEYIEHRLERERKLLEGLKAGRRSVAELLDSAWPDVSEQMRGVAAITLAAHLDKLDEEGLLPEDVERPTW
jgi:glyoxylase-like metal-dependent hydrolase (beta-lactamase superfamily II)